MMECTNANKVPLGSKGVSLPCIEICIRRGKNGRVAWKDQLPGSSCSALTASKSMAALGTADGSVQLFGCSHTMGWKSGCGFRCAPPLIVGHPVVALQVVEEEQKQEGGGMSDGGKTPEMTLLVLTGDGSFGVYKVLPRLKLEYRGSILPPMTHMTIGLTQTVPRL